MNTAPTITSTTGLLAAALNEMEAGHYMSADSALTWIARTSWADSGRPFLREARLLVAAEILDDPEAGRRREISHAARALHIRALRAALRRSIASDQVAA